MADNEDWLVVAALDFGTMYSGYAFSFRDSPNDIHTPQTWYAGSTPLASSKTPTCLLLNPDKTFNSFGYEAQDKYADLASEERHREYLYFEHFKMTLHYEKHLSRKTTLDDILGKTIPAMDVFSMSIKFLKNHVMKTLRDRLPTIILSDVRFVLTVPAIWTDSAKEFMHEAAEMAGIASNRLILALEPEAASIHCQNIPTEILTSGAGLSISEVGTQYLIADIGGGTGDFTVHEKLDNGKLKEVSKASGGAFGGINVDKRLFHFFSKLFGEEAFTQLKSEEICDYLDIFRDFEIKKRTVTDDCEKNYVIRLPSSLLQFASNNNPGFRKNAESTDFKGHVNFWHDKLKIDSTLMKSLFTESIQNITTHIEGILQGFPKVRQILLVGGYGECIILQDDIRKCFPQQDLIIPQECELAVVKGAVLFGHDSKVIFERILRYSYGTNSHSKFDPSVHCEDRKYVDDYGITRCRGSFYTLVKAGEKITSKGHIISSAIFALSKNQSEIEYKIFYTEKTNTIYLDDDCKFLGKLIIPLTGDKDTNRKCNVSFTFGLTEICCKVTEKSSGRDIEAKFEMLE